MATRYWVGGTGTWSAAGTTHWSATSGGSSGASAPTSSDDVVFDALSGVGTITITSASIACKSLDSSTYLQSFTLSGSGVLTIGNSSGGSLNIGAMVTLTTSSTNSFVFASTISGNTSFSGVS